MRRYVGHILFIESNAFGAPDSVTGNRGSLNSTFVNLPPFGNATRVDPELTGGFVHRAFGLGQVDGHTLD